MRQRRVSPENCQKATDGGLGWAPPAVSVITRPQTGLCPDGADPNATMDRISVYTGDKSGKTQSQDHKNYERQIIMSKASKMRINPHTKLPESGKYREERLARKAGRRAKRAARREAVFGKDVV